MNNGAVGIARALIRYIMGIRPVLYGARYLARVRLLPKAAWKRLPVETDFPIRIGDISFIYSSSAYDSIGRMIFWGGECVWEHESMYVFSRLARRARLILDIGANTGIYTLISLAASSGSRVISFEPVPKLRERLINNLKVNCWSNRCDVKECAVANARGRTKFHVPDLPMPTTSSLHAAGFRGVKGDLIDVDVVTADEVVGSNDTVDLVKMDIEGFEHKALEGMTRILSVDQPVIMLECNPDGPAKEIEKILLPLGYRFFHLLEDGPLPVSGIRTDSASHFRNFLCVPASKLNWIDVTAAPG